MKGNWLFLFLCGFVNVQCYTYRVINRTQQDINATLAVYNMSRFLCTDKYLSLGTVKPRQQVTKTWGGVNAGCLMMGLNANSTWRDVRLKGGGGRSGNLTFLVFNQGDKGPFIQWDEGIREAWDPTDKDKRRPYPGDRPELPIVEVKN